MEEFSLINCIAVSNKRTLVESDVKGGKLGNICSNNQAAVLVRVF